MKTIKILLFSVLFSSLGLSAFAQDVNVYNYCYAYSVKTEVFWVSNIVSGVEPNSSDPNRIFISPDRVGLKNQWNDKLKTILEEDDYLRMEIDAFVWMDYDEIDEERTKKIGEFKQEGYQIYYVKDMRYRQSKYED